MNRFDELYKEVQSIVNGNSIKVVARHKVTFVPVQKFTPQEIKQIRLNARMTQSVFAQCIGVTQKSVEAWEGGRSTPDGAARRLLGLMQNNPNFACDAGIYTWQDVTE